MKCKLETYCAVRTLDTVLGWRLLSPEDGANRPIFRRQPISCSGDSQHPGGRTDTCPSLLGTANVQASLRLSLLVPWVLSIYARFLFTAVCEPYLVNIL